MPIVTLDERFLIKWLIDLIEWKLENLLKLFFISKIFSSSTNNSTFVSGVIIT